jgi:nucleotide-binding universal stress UspA family protein
LKPRNVVIPLDGSRHADRGILQGKRIAKALHLGIGAMTVAVNAEEGRFAMLNEVVADEHLDWSETALSPRVAEGINAVAQERAAIVSMATHGHGRSVALIGSIPEEVVRHCALPVMLIGPGVEIYEQGPIEELVVAVGGSLAGEVICAPAAAWAHEFGFQLHFVTVVQPTPEPADPAAPSDRWFGPAGDEHAYMADLVSRYESPGLDVNGSVIYDPISPASGLAQMLRERPDAVLVLGTHGRTGMTRLVHGSVASNIVSESPVPVLMFPFHHQDS